MYWKEIGFLCQPIEAFDKFNRPKQSGFKETKVFCNKKGVRQTEFYQAQAQGLKPEVVFEVKQYAEQNHFKFEGKLYRIIRSYTRNDEVIELTCTSILATNE